MKVDPGYIDISPPLSEDLAVFPGDVPFRRKIQMDMERGDHLGLSSFTTTVHIGAHADAPSHYGRGEKAIDALHLGAYMGLAQIIEVKKKPGERIYPDDLSLEDVIAPRVLFLTDSFPDPKSWNSDFNSLSPELIQCLADKKVQLVGIDTPSVDPAESKNLESHQMLLKTGLRVLEGLVLRHVQPGLYTLLALPLALADSDASPVRAILLPKNWDPSQH